MISTSQSKPKTGGYELQLPSVASLTSVISSQDRFLRILRVILQLRDAARLADSKNKRKQTESQSPSLPVVTSLLSATVEATAAPASLSDTTQTAPSGRTSGDAPEAPALMEVCYKA